MENDKNISFTDELWQTIQNSWHSWPVMDTQLADELLHEVVELEIKSKKWFSYNEVTYTMEWPITSNKLFHRMLKQIIKPK